IVIREGERQKRKKVGLDYVLYDNDVIEIKNMFSIKSIKNIADIVGLILYIKRPDKNTGL
ncbi:hypothetical protein LCGC14_2217140, partial [marine sediment metagenome]